MLKNLFDIGENLHQAIQDNLDNNAIFVEEKTYTYNQLFQRSIAIKSTILNLINPSEEFIGILCYKSINAYVGILGTLLSKHAYLPLNPANPKDKLQKIITLSECKTIILGEECADIFLEISDIKTPLTLICPEPGKKLKDLKSNNTQHTFIFPDQFPISDILTNTCIEESSPAYLMFTSGTTGDPKGIVVSHKNLIAYCDYTIEKYKFTENDRVSQIFDITFDLSVHDIITTFLSGGCLYVVPKKSIISPGDFIRKHELTVWFSVPSIAMFMDRTKTLKKNSLPSLRYSLFCGEGLPCNTAQQWQLAATNSTVENLYGPTEATIAFMDFRWGRNIENQCINGIVPIGKPFKGIEVKLIFEGKEADSGELYVSGNQIVKGYLKNDKLTKEKFVCLSAKSEKIWYRTGDLAKKINNNNYAFLGRVDDQVQVRGYRVEILEIDKIIRDAVGHQMAVSVPIFSKENNYAVEDILAFVEKDDKNLSEKDIIFYCKSLLPEYMVPSKVYIIQSMPLNENGKIDKKALVAMINDKELSCEAEDSLSHKKLETKCSSCLKSLKEDEDMNGMGLLKILNHQGNDDYICHVCMKGF